MSEIEGRLMIRITIELWPHGNENTKEVIGLIDISNDGTGTSSRGNYQARFPRSTKNWYFQKIVTNWPRNSKTIYQLVREVLNQIVRP